MKITEAIDRLETCLTDIKNDDILSPTSRALRMAIEALKQESVLDKIRVEIEKAVWEDSIVSFDGTDEVIIPRLDPDDVFEIIDKYKAESEKKE